MKRSQFGLMNEYGVNDVLARLYASLMRVYGRLCAFMRLTFKCYEFFKYLSSCLEIDTCYILLQVIL